MSSPRIVADERERKSGIPGKLTELGVSVDFKQLGIGDYLVSPDCAVERKSIRDMIRSIYDKRLFSQCSELSTSYAKPILLIEGNPGSVDERLENPSVFYGALASLVLDFRIAILSTVSKEQTAAVLSALAKRILKEKHTGPLLKKGKKMKEIDIQRLSILASLPGVGDKLALRMLNKFKTPIKALNAPTSELARIEGMGHTRAVKLRKLLDAAEFEKRDEKQDALDRYGIENG